MAIFKTVLIFGNGWIGQKFAKEISGAEISKTDIADERAVQQELERQKPDCLINCAGKTGHPNIDSCEKDLSGTLRSNVIGPLILANIAKAKGIYMVHLGSGCVYDGDAGGKGYAESDPPNFFGSLYSRSKILAENALKEFPVLQLRLRLPMSSEPAPRNLITKLVTYRQVVKIANSVTVLEDFLPTALRLMERGETGIFNLVNEGREYHDELLNLYREIVDPEFQFSVISLDTLGTRVKAPRSNCLLNTDKLKKLGLALPSLQDSLRRILPIYAARLKGTGR